jgi:hypothetical protein
MSILDCPFGITWPVSLDYLASFLDCAFLIAPWVLSG